MMPSSSATSVMSASVSLLAPLVPFLALLGASLLLHPSECATHWVISQDGRLTPVDISPYAMRDPADLINVMRQEQRVGEAERLEREREQLVDQLTQLTTSAQHVPRPRHSPSASSGQKLGDNVPHSTEGDDANDSDDDVVDPNCSAYSAFVSSGGADDARLFHLDPYFSIHIPMHLFNIYVKQQLGVMNRPSLAPQTPNCGDPLTQRPLSNEDNMLFFSKLKGIRESSGWGVKPEPGLRSVFQHEDIDQIGHLIKRHLLSLSSSSSAPPSPSPSSSDLWATFNLATLFWRVKGDSVEALKCVRQAVDVLSGPDDRTSTPYEPDSRVCVPLVDMASLLHKHHFHSDAIFVASVALQHCTPSAHALIHTLLANVHCLPVMAEWDNCLESLGAVLASEDHTVQSCAGSESSLHVGVREKIEAVRCVKRMERQLQLEQSYLQQLLDKQQQLTVVRELHADKVREIESLRASDEELMRKEHQYRMHSNTHFSHLIHFFRHHHPYPADHMSSSFSHGSSTTTTVHVEKFDAESFKSEWCGQHSRHRVISLSPSSPSPSASSSPLTTVSALYSKLCLSPPSPSPSPPLPPPSSPPPKRDDSSSSRKHHRSSQQKHKSDNNNRH